jgi:apolipoprotein N-acyltransferase
MLKHLKQGLGLDMGLLVGGVGGMWGATVRISSLNSCCFLPSDQRHTRERNLLQATRNTSPTLALSYRDSSADILSLRWLF